MWCSPSCRSAAASASKEGDEARRGEHPPQFGGCGERGVQRGEIARAAPAEAQPGHRPLDVGTAAQGIAHIGAQVGSVEEEGKRVEPVRDRPRVGQRSGEVTCQQACAGAGRGTVDRGEQAAAPLTG